MIRYVYIVLIVCSCLSSYGQPISSQKAVTSYNLSQKRLLVISTAQFINILSQNNLDQDSIMAVASRLTGSPFFLPYNEGILSKSVPVGADLINTRNITKAVRLLNNLKGEKRVQLLMELGIWYLHQPGIDHSDLDHAKTFIQEVLTLSPRLKDSSWRYESLNLMGQYYSQHGDVPESKKTFLRIISFCQQDGNKEMLARAWHQLGKLSPFSDPLKLSYFNKSLAVYEQLHQPEKEIELLGEMASYHLKSDVDLAEKDMNRILVLQRSTGYRHTAYATYLLSFIRLNQANYLDALKYANDALENLNWSGISALSSVFFTRIGATYWVLGKKEVALIWFKKALDKRTNDTHLFWYKSLFYTGSLLIEMNREGEALALIQEVTQDFPPTSIWEQGQLLSIRGLAYEGQKNYPLAEKNFLMLLRLSDHYPVLNAEFSESYFDIANFYVSRSNLQTARLFLKKARESSSRQMIDLVNENYLSFKIDSMAGDYKSAMQNHIQYKFHYDSVTNMDQRKKLDELTVKYGAEKKDKDIKLLKQQETVQQMESGQNKLIRNIMIAVTLLLLIIVGLLFNQFKLKQRTNLEINKNYKALEQMVIEKEWLLKEVHHRVKNNLHTIICLLESQAIYLENDALKAVENSQHRIYAMSLIHQKLYQSEDIKTIDMSIYIPELVQYLKDSFGVSGQIHFNLNIDLISLNIAQAIPLGLIINEVITNSIKYAFPDNQRGEISISMENEDDQIKLKLADNGIGIKQTVKDVESDSLGLELIKGLSNDINADINFTTDQGTIITIIFQVDPLNDSDIFLTSLRDREIYI